MSQQHSAPHGNMEPVLRIERVFKAPLDLVWKSFTEADRMKEWFGAVGSPITVEEFNLVPGGRFHYHSVYPDGTEVWGLFIYAEIEAPRRLVYINSFSDPEGGLTRNPWAENWPLEVRNVATFEALSDGSTRLKQESTPVNATVEERALFAASLGNMQTGYSGTLEQLEDYLARQQT